MGDDLRAADVFKVFVDTNSSMRTALESNVRAFTELVAKISALDQSVRDHSEGIKEVVSTLKDMRSSMIKEIVEENKKQTEIIVAAVKSAAAAHAPQPNENRKIIYALLAACGVLLLAVLGLVGAKFAEPPKIPNIPALSSDK